MRGANIQSRGKNGKNVAVIKNVVWAGCCEEGLRSRANLFFHLRKIMESLIIIFYPVKEISQKYNNDLLISYF
jgi:hypothetical protein